MLSDQWVKRAGTPDVPFTRSYRRRDGRRRQRACLEHVDGLLAPLIEALLPATAVITADHGDCWGEEGLWEHGISHRRTLEVPLLIRVRGVPIRLGVRFSGGFFSPFDASDAKRCVILGWPRTIHN